VAGILAPLVTGLLIKATGSYTPAFVLAAVSIAAGQLSFWLIVGPLSGEGKNARPTS
jgi:dipeptide/tripeptide permease